MKKYHLLFMLIFMLSCTCNKNSTKISPSLIKSYYEVLMLAEIGDNYPNVLKKADSCINLIKSDTSQYLIDLLCVKADVYNRINKKDSSLKYYDKSLSLLSKKIETSPKRNIDNIMSKAYILCFMNRCDEAVNYIKSIDFTKEELEYYGENTPISLIEGYVNSLK